MMDCFGLLSSLWCFGNGHCQQFLALNCINDSRTSWLVWLRNLKRCFKRKYISYQINIYDVPEEADRALFKKISIACPVTLCILPSPKQKKVLRASEFLAANFLGSIPNVLKIVLLIDFFKI